MKFCALSKGRGAQGISAYGNRDKKVKKTKIIQMPTAAGNGKYLLAGNCKFVNYNLVSNGYCLILSEISFD